MFSRLFRTMIAILMKKKATSFRKKRTPDLEKKRSRIVMRITRVMMKKKVVTRMRDPWVVKKRVEKIGTNWKKKQEKV